MKAYLTELLKLPQEARRASTLPAVLVMAVAVSVTFAASVLTHLDDIAEGRSRFEGLSEKLAYSIGETMDSYEQVLRGGAGLFNAFGNVSRSSWSIYVSSLRLRENYPGMQGVGFISVIDPKSIDAFVTAVRAEGLPDFTVHPAGLREAMSAVLYIEPLDWRNRRALGHDMYSEPIRRKAMARARDTGEASLSGGVRLIQETDEDIQAGVLLFLPVYAQGSAIQGREDHLVGFIYGPFRMNDLLTSTLNRTQTYDPNLIRVEVFDGEKSESSGLLFDSHTQTAQDGDKADSASRHQLTRQLTVHGAPWILRFSSTAAFERTAASNRPLIVALIGTLLSALGAAIVGLMSLGRETARRAARNLSEEAAIRQQAEEQTRVALRELAHRVKNTFSIVTAIASQTVRHSESLAEFDRAFRTRLLGLSRVHDLLASGRTYSTDLAALTDEVLRPYRGDGEHSLKLRGPPVLLAPNTAILLSMLLNELATNAMKYGAWSSASGEVDLTWDVTECEAGNALSVLWRESGGPSVKTPSRSGFGSNVIKFAVERSLGGTANADFAASGVTYEIKIPWDQIKETSDITIGDEQANA